MCMSTIIITKNDASSDKNSYNVIKIVQNYSLLVEIDK